MFCVEWLPDHPNVLLQTVPSTWTVNEFVDSMHEIVEYLQQYPEITINLICDMFASKGLPLGVASAAPYVSSMIQPNSGLIVLVGLNAIEVQLLHALRHLIFPLRKRIQLEETVPEAVDLILASRA